jgi:hypothetical protein
MTLKVILKKQDGKALTGFPSLRRGTKVADSEKRGKNFLVPYKART